MSESIPLTLPRQIHDDIVILQGQEIIRIRELLQTSEPRLDALKEENEQLRTEHEQTLKELEDLRAQPPPPIEEEKDETEQPVRLVNPRAAFLNIARLPRYKALQIPAFYVGRSPRTCLRYLKERMGYLRLALFRGGEEEWQAGYDTCYIVRPERRRRRDGTWVETKLVRPQRSVQVISQVYGRWYYLGSYQCATVVPLNSETWDVLPEKTQRGILRFMAHGEFKDEAKEKILQGEVPLTRIELHRVEFDERLQRVLLTAGVKQLTEADSDGSGTGGDPYG